MSRIPPLHFAVAAAAIFSLGAGSDRQAAAVEGASTPGPDRAIDLAEGVGNPAEIGRHHPPLEVDALDGTLVNARRVAGRPFVVGFFATWCQPCHRALEDLLAARRLPGGEAVQVVLIDLGEAPEVVQGWAASAQLPPGVLVALDPRGMAARRWGARRLPTTYLVDADGTVRKINRGWGSGYRKRLARWLAEVAAPTPPAAPDRSQVGGPPASPR